jgi:hypothetical protein
MKEELKKQIIEVANEELCGEEMCVVDVKRENGSLETYSAIIGEGYTIVDIELPTAPDYPIEDIFGEINEQLNYVHKRWQLVEFLTDPPTDIPEIQLFGLYNQEINQLDLIRVFFGGEAYYELIKTVKLS